MLQSAQYVALKADIVTRGLQATPEEQIKGIYNSPASPTFFVYRTAVSRDEVMLDGFDWTRVDNLTLGKARIWDWMFSTGFINPSNITIRAGIVETWKGTAADVAVRVVVFSHCQRPASVFEKLFAGVGGTTIAEDGTGPATMGAAGPLSIEDIQIALAQP